MSSAELKKLLPSLPVSGAEALILQLFQFESPRLLRLEFATSVPPLTLPLDSHLLPQLVLLVGFELSLARH